MSGTGLFVSLCKQGALDYTVLPLRPPSRKIRFRVGPLNVSQQHILVVDDELEIRQLLATYLEKNGYRVTAVGDGKEMWQALDQARVDLIVLDLMLPGTDGLELCRTLRARSKIPVIMLTALGDEMDRVLGLEMGADDYIPKPFSARELLARIKVVLRRVYDLPPDSLDEGLDHFEFSSWKLDARTQHLTAPDGLVTPLSHAEYRLLHVLLSHPNRVLNRDQLLDLTQGREGGPFDRSIDVLIGQLRKHLAEDAKQPVLIKTVRSHGYMFAGKVLKNG